MEIAVLVVVRLAERRGDVSVEYVKREEEREKTREEK